MLTAEDTIAAIATPAGKGAISMIRISGAQSLAIAASLFEPVSKETEIRPFHAHLGKLYDRHHRLLDNVVLLYYRHPKSYTGEDLIEICCHGSPVVTAEILGELQHQGARCAERGEFTLRAFLNGKIDLARAESIRQLVESQTRRQAKIAVQQIDGGLSSRVEEIKEAMLRVIVEMETALEFLEEEPRDRERQSDQKTIEELAGKMNQMLRSCEKGRVLSNGIKVAVVGRTNAGKSSIFNQIAKKERAIVYHLPGTTRDTIQETVDINGIPVTIIDTAGWRRTKNSIEKEGVRRSETAMKEADMALLVIDSEKGFSRTEKLLKEKAGNLGKEMLLVWNKVDRLTDEKLVELRSAQGSDSCFVSAKTGQGMESLLKQLEGKVLPENPEQDGAILIGIRLQDCLQRSLACLLAAGERITYGYTEEFVLNDLKESMKILGEITGETATEEILGRIFSQFCIGK